MIKAAAIAIILLVAPSAWAVQSAYGQAENMADPAACGPTACPTYHAELATFPYWDRQIRPYGYSGGSLGDGSYVYLGTVNGAGYLLSSDHSGPYSADASFVFVAGAHDGKHYRASGEKLYPTVTKPEGGTDDWPHLIRVTTMQYAPGCASVDTAQSGPETCCDGYGLGDGTCAASGTGDACDAGAGGCKVDALPDLPWVELATPSEITPGSTLLLSWGFGAMASVQRQWYLECAIDTDRGGSGSAPDGCCSLQYTRAFGETGWRSHADGHPSFGLAGNESDWHIGGVGTNCDTYGGGPGYTYLGPVGMAGAELTSYGGAEAPMSWIVGVAGSWLTWEPPTWRPGAEVGNYAVARLLTQVTANPTYRSDSGTARCWMGWDPKVPSGPKTGADYLAALRAPMVRNGGRADCLASMAASGDSGSPTWAYTAGGWKLIGEADAGNFGASVFYSMRWWWWTEVFGSPFGGSR